MATLEVRNGIYYATALQAKIVAMFTEAKDLEHPEVSKWLMNHARFRHCANEPLYKVTQSKVSQKANDNFPGCARAKLTARRFKSRPRPPGSPLQVVLSDTSGPHPQSIEGYQYWTSFLCAETRHIEVILHKSRAESASKWISTAKRQQRLTGRYIGEYRTGEFKSTEVSNFLEEEGILSRTTEPYIPQTNGQPERFVRSMNTKSRAMLTYSGLPVKFWPQAVQEAARLYNRTPRQYQSKQWATPLSRYQPELRTPLQSRTFPSSSNLDTI